MKVALISRSGRLLLRNSRVFNKDHLYFLMIYAASAHVALDCPLTEWTSTLSVAYSASSTNSKIAFAASSLESSTIYRETVRNIWILDCLNLARRKLSKQLQLVPSD